MEPAPAPDLESSSDAYARRFAGEIGGWFLERQTRGVLDLLQPLGRLRILEVGGGHAQLTASLVEAGHRVTVQGTDESCAVRLRRLFSERAVPFVGCPLDRLPFDAGSFDAVVSIRMMAHVDDPSRFVSECARVARQGVLVDYPSKKSANFLADLLFELKQGVEKDTRTYRCFDDAEVRGLFADHGLRPAGETRQFFWPMALHRAHKSARAGRALEGPARALGLARLLGSPVLALFRR
jgi:2-polyprenyl-3-methyl-5-hydroxy-6-metoxy-1,4-benzoquinol methylase